MSSTDRIEKQVLLRAPLARVWRALTDHVEFGIWFKVKLESPFVVGGETRGQITYPGHEHLTMKVRVETMEPQRLFALRWHPYDPDPNVDLTKEPTTLVEFRLEETAGGTLLTLSESGFDRVPAPQREEAYRRNEGGWTEQVQNIRRHVEA